MTISLTLLAAVGAVLPAGGVGRPLRHVERPPSQAGVPGSVASIAVVTAFPAGTSYLEFDYVVDCEQNDRLEVFAIGFSPAPIWSVSGLNMGGRARVPVTLAVDTLIVVRFQYTKNNDSLHGGADTAWVNRVQFVHEQAGIFYSSSFGGEALDTTPAGWQGGGFAGGWVVRPPGVARSAMRRPGQQHGEQSFFEKSVSFPAATGAVDFDYYVDSEAGHDFLRFFLDGVEADLEPEVSGVQGISGRDRRGHASVRVATPGVHTLRFEYSKDAAGSEGLDVARVDRIYIRRAGAVPDLFHDFHEREGMPGGIRHQAGGPIEWSGDWVAARSSPHRTYLPLQQLNQEWAPHWASFNLPVMDGVVMAEYRNPVRIDLPDFSSGAAGGSGGRLFLVAGEGAIHLGLRVPAATPPAGGEQGKLRLFLDEHHLATMSGVGGCGDGSDLPDPSDRRIDLTYNFSQPVLLTPDQQRGTCNPANPWVNVDAENPAWDITLAFSEPAQDAGFVHLEIRIVPPPDGSGRECPRPGPDSGKCWVGTSPGTFPLR